jgi:hypothetical protein
MGVGSCESTASSHRAHLQRSPGQSTYSDEPSSQEHKLGRIERLTRPQGRRGSGPGDRSVGGEEVAQHIQVHGSAQTVVPWVSTVKLSPPSARKLLTMIRWERLGLTGTPLSQSMTGRPCCWWPDALQP